MKRVKFDPVKWCLKVVKFHLSEDAMSFDQLGLSATPNLISEFIHHEYPLVNIQKAIENGDLVRGFSH